MLSGKKSTAPPEGPRPGANAEGGRQDEPRTRSSQSQRLVARPIVEANSKHKYMIACLVRQLKQRRWQWKEKRTPSQRHGVSGVASLLGWPLSVVAVLVVIGVALGLTLPTSSSPSTTMASAPPVAPIPDSTCLMERYATCCFPNKQISITAATTITRRRHSNLFAQSYGGVEYRRHASLVRFEVLYFCTGGDEWSAWLENGVIRGAGAWYSRVGCFFNSRPFSILALEHTDLVGTRLPFLGYLRLGPATMLCHRPLLQPPID